ncbi:MAG TPA: MAPEG family protein [Stellaceae bacterium]|nr:MAPEG family protein [Stellaceae bacterium]
MSLHLYPALATCLALLVYLWTVARVALARGRYKIAAPAVTGHPDFERHFRIQQNTVEQLVLFLPSLWVFSLTVSQIWAGIIGLVFVAARLLYVVSYARNPAARGPGFTIGFVACVVLLLGGLAGTLRFMLVGI